MRVKYIVKEEDGVVVCIGEDTILDALKDLGYESSEMVELVKTSDVIPYLIRDSYKGVAKLSGEDKWDEKVGKKIAYAKMKNKYLAAKGKVVGRVLEDLMATADGLVDILESYDNETLPLESSASQ